MCVAGYSIKFSFKDDLNDGRDVVVLMFTGSFVPQIKREKSPGFLKHRIWMSATLEE